MVNPCVGAIILILSVFRPRFKFNNVDKTNKKMENHIEFPLNDFNIGDHLSQSERSRNTGVFNLCGVSNHLGPTVTEGHYIAYCKNKNRYVLRFVAMMLFGYNIVKSTGLLLIDSQ